MKRALIILCMLSVAAPAWAGFNESLRRANALVRSGDPEQALLIYRRLLTERPGSPLLLHGMGCAYHELGTEQQVLEDVQGAAKSFAEARNLFEAAASTGEIVRQEAAYNAANAQVARAKALAAVGETRPAVELLRQAVGEYEELPRGEELGPRIEQNLGHARYVLKRLLQEQQDEEPPPMPEQQEEQQTQEEEEQPGEEQEAGAEGQAGAPEEPEQPEEPQPSEEESEAGADAAAPPDAPPPSPSEGEEGQAEGEAAAATALDAPPEAFEDGQMLSPSIEAILESLEEQDEREQERMRQGPAGGRAGEQWW
jgi:hypothetical protein